MTILFLLPVMYAAICVLGGGRAWTGWVSVALHGGLGLLLAGHTTLPESLSESATVAVFQSARSIAVAVPIFGADGMLLALCAFYDAYRE